jgi:hypothetical protein
MTGGGPAEGSPGASHNGPQWLNMDRTRPAP